MTTENIKVSIPFEMDYDTLESMIVGAIEGGSNYWASMRSEDLPESIREKYKGEPFSVKVSKAIWEWHTVKVYDAEDENESWSINRTTVEKALVMMATDYSNHFNDMITENHDTITADIFFQLASIGEITYG